PDLFGGTWTLYPDPLDFHHFQMVNLYDDSNAFQAPGLGEWLQTPRYMSRQPDGQPLVNEQQMSRAEAVLGTHGRSGQQLDVFFSTFGPIGADGSPVPLWDLNTGVIKIHVYVGDMDTYYLNLGVYDMQNFLKTTQNPHYEGTFVYGRPEKPHGWNGGITQAEMLRQIFQAVRR